ncbi:MAG: hypothetical protein HMLIMOIP_002604 [Candidatus Nitrosomirales archaeon]|jgi:hypothetical protein
MALLSKPNFGSNSSLMQKGWLDFRNGHSVYLSFILTFMNSILIAYHFAISQFALMDNIFFNVGLFAMFFLGVYIPASVIIGYWHRRHQWTVENEALLQENWVWAWIARYQIRLIEGKANEQETKQVMDYLEAILQRQKKNGASLMGSKILNPDGRDSSLRNAEKVCSVALDGSVKS